MHTARWSLSFFAVFAVYGVVAPWLPVVIRGMGYGPALIGLLLGIYEVAGVFGPFASSRLVERLGRRRPGYYRPVLFIAIFLMGLSFPALLSFRTPLLTALLLALFATGLRSPTPLLDAAASLDEGARARYGLIRTIGTLGFLAFALLLQFTPVFRPVEGRTDFAANILIWLLVALALCFASFILLPGQGKKREEVKADSSAPQQAVPGVFIVGLLFIGLGRLAMAPVNSFVSLWVTEELAWNAVPLMWALSAASEVPFILFSAPLLRRFGTRRLLVAASLGLALRLALYALFPTRAGAIAGQLLHSASFGLFHPAAVAFVATWVPPALRARGMVMYLSLGVGLPGFLGSSAGGLLVEHFGYRTLFVAFIPCALASALLFTVFARYFEGGSAGQIMTSEAK